MRFLIPRLIFVVCAPPALACQPLGYEAWENSQTRVKSNFDAAQFVVSADVIDVQRLSVPDHIGSSFKFQVERVTFRIKRVFKGLMRPGATFTIDSGKSSCGRSVIEGQSIASTWTRKPRVVQDYPKRWLIYYTPPPVMPGPMQLPPFEITSSPLSRPEQSASYDISVLEALAALNRRRAISQEG